MRGKAGKGGPRVGRFAARVLLSGAVLAIAIAVIYSIGVSDLIHRQKLENLFDEAEQVGRLVDQVTFGGKVSGATQTLGLTHKRIKNLVRGDLSPDDPQVLMDLLLLRDAYSVSLVYVLDVNGTVVACTPYGANRTLTGSNYSFRPYFQQALQGSNIVYPAIGVTTGKRGLYFASPVYLPGQGQRRQIGGVVVAKMSLSAVDQVLETRPDPTAVVSPSGIVFASNRWGWVQRNAFRPGKQQIARVVKTRQFGEGKATDLYSLDVDSSGSRVTLPEGDHLVAKTPLALQDSLGDWRLVLLQKAPDPQIFAVILLGCAIIASVYIGVGFYFVSRRQRRLLELENDRASREAAETYKSIFHSANDVIFVHEMGTGRIVDANEQCLDQYGYTPDEIMRLDVDQLSLGEPPYSGAEAARWLQAAEREGPQVFEWQAKKKTGENFWVEVSLRRGDIGGSPRVLSVVRDVSGRKEAELELQRLNARLSESTRNAQRLARRAEMSSRAKSDFLARMSHEIRTPMNGVLGMTELLQTTELNPRQRQLADTARRSGESLLAVINDILDFSKIEAGKLELDTIDFDLQEVIEDAVEMFAEGASRKGLELAVWVPPTLPRWLRGDPGRLRQILTNLLGNAVKFTEHGEVIVQVSELEATPQAVFLRIEVRDTGIGLESEARERVFDSFAQADVSSARRYGGTGLGLSIARQLAGLLRGEIGLESAPGQGSTFWFTARFARQTEPVPDAGVDAGRFRGLRVLVVDDNEASGRILRDYLVAWQAEVTVVEGAERALHVLKEACERDAPFELVLADQDMPVINGHALVQAIRRQEILQQVPVVLLLPVASEIDAEVQQTGLATRLGKPVRQQQLFQVVKEALGEGVTDDSMSLVDCSADGNGCIQLNLKVLLAEDNPVNQLVGQEMLALLGCEVHLVEDGGKALQVLQAKTFDVVLMDCDMPVINGYEVTRRIRRHEHARGAPRIPILALTAGAMVGDRELALESGMDDYLSKPIEQAMLRKALQRWVPTQTPAHGNARALKAG